LEFSAKDAQEAVCR